MCSKIFMLVPWAGSVRKPETLIIFWPNCNHYASYFVRTCRYGIFADMPIRRYCCLPICRYCRYFHIRLVHIHVLSHDLAKYKHIVRELSLFDPLSRYHPRKGGWYSTYIYKLYTKICLIGPLSRPNTIFAELIKI